MALAYPTNCSTDINPTWDDLQRTPGMIVNWGLGGAPYDADHRPMLQARLAALGACGLSEPNERVEVDLLFGWRVCDGSGGPFKRGRFPWPLSACESVTLARSIIPFETDGMARPAPLAICRNLLPTRLSLADGSVRRPVPDRRLLRVEFKMEPRRHDKLRR
jgi:hypothetical protein